MALSGGRDSGSIAVALQEAGVQATCFTHRFPPGVQDSEEVPARRLAQATGHLWKPVPVTPDPDETALRRMTEWAATPLAYTSFPLSTAPVEAAAEAGLDTLMAGDGGEPLFSAAPVAVLDLLRRGRPRAALIAARNYDHSWTYPYSMVAKAAVRAALPRNLVAARERLRPIPPWVAGTVRFDYNPLTAPRSAAKHLEIALSGSSGPAYAIEERLHRMSGLDHAYPLLDLRVVRIACGLPLDLRAPVPMPKPALEYALLGRLGLGRDRVKTVFGSYFARFAQLLQSSHPWLFAPESPAVRLGFVRKEGLEAIQDRRWLIHSALLMPVQVWLDERKYG